MVAKVAAGLYRLNNTVNETNLTSGGCQGFIHVYDHYFQASSSQKPLGQSKPNIMLEGGTKIYKLSRTISLIILKLGM